VDEARHADGDASGDRRANAGHEADRPDPPSGWSAAEAGWLPEDAEWSRRAVWSESAWNAAGSAWSTPDRADDVPAGPDASADRSERRPGADDPDVDPAAHLLDPAHDREPAVDRDAGEVPRPSDAIPGGGARAGLTVSDRSWADRSARYPDPLPPLSSRPRDREGYPSNGSLYLSPDPQPIPPHRQPVEPVSPPALSGAGTDYVLSARSVDDPEMTPPAIPLPRSAPPLDRVVGDRGDPLTSIAGDEAPQDSVEDAHRVSPRPVRPPRDPSAPPSRGVPPGQTAPSGRAVPSGRAAVRPVVDFAARAGGRLGEQQPSAATASDDHLVHSAEPVGWPPPGGFASRRQAQLDDEPSVDRPRRLAPPLAAEERPAPSSAAPPQPAPAPRPTDTVATRAENREREVAATPHRHVDQIDRAGITPPTRPARPAAQPVPAAADAADTEVLPQRVPAEPDVPTVPEPTVGPPAEPPELARIASHLRRSDAALPHERPEGFDVNAILAAVREVPGVADASLRTTPAGAHKLRLDLADGADSAEVSRQVARLLQERMGLAAAPPDQEGSDSPVDAPPAPAPPVDEAEASDPILSRRRRAGSHRGRAAILEQPREGRPGAVGRAPVASGSVTAAYRSGQLTESAPSRSLPAGTRPGPRVVIDHVQVSTFGLSASVDVRLSAGGRVATGAASGPAVDGYVLRLCAAATAAAVDELLRTAAPVPVRGRCFVEHAAAVSLGACEVATVVVLLVHEGWVEQLAGSALVSGDPRAAVVRATLAAINRRLEALLA
jgi:hypothetical protein